ncbi:phosphotriesterase family protein [Leucobacter sp. gxy201]|uniref:phosphotriesterase family protein n=1 Tax=Leucobacter sp. gxy201 TaxID=2957200 RepID=UPI003DA03137
MTITPLRALPTYTGDIPGDEVGVTLVHEHIFVGDAELDRNFPHPEWDEERAVESAVADLVALHARGVRTVVDLTVMGLGRNAGLVARVAERSPVRLVAATGWYAAETLPPYFRINGPGRLIDGDDPLIEMFLTDITTGIAGTGVRAGALKIASDEAGITVDAARVFRAAATAQAETGVPLMTHSHSPSRGGLAQQEMLAGLGVPLDRVAIGHAGDSADLDYLREMADRGSYLGFDRFGMEHAAPDEQRIRTLLELCELGYEDRILVSHDAASFSRVTPPSWRREHAPAWRMDHFFTGMLPELRRRGADDALIERLLVDNPRRLLLGS